MISHQQTRRAVEPVLRLAEAKRRASSGNTAWRSPAHAAAGRYVASRYMSSLPTARNNAGSSPGGKTEDSSGAVVGVGGSSPGEPSGSRSNLLQSRKLPSGVIPAPKSTSALGDGAKVRAPSEAARTEPPAASTRSSNRTLEPRRAESRTLESLTRLKPSSSVVAARIEQRLESLRRPEEAAPPGAAAARPKPAAIEEHPTSKLPPTTEEQAYFSYIRLLQWKYLSLKAERTFAEQQRNVQRQLLLAAELLRDENRCLQILKLEFDQEQRSLAAIEILERQVGKNCG